MLFPIILDRFSEIPVELVRLSVVREHNLYPNAPVGSLGVVRRCKAAIEFCEGREQQRKRRYSNVASRTSTSSRIGLVTVVPSGCNASERLSVGTTMPQKA
jgi:hypothetical protein